MAGKGDRIGKGYKVTGNQLDAIFGGLLTSGKGMSQALTESQSRDLAAISRISRRGTGAARRSVQDATAGAVNRYGSVMGQAVETAMAPSRAAARATGAIAKGDTRAAHTLAQAGQLGMDIQQQAAAEAQAAANYANAVALHERVQQREKEREAQSGTGSQDYQQASAGLLDAAQTMDYDGARAYVSVLGSMYSLGPKAMGKLREQLATLYPTGEGLSNINTQQASEQEGPTNQFGEPIVWQGSLEQRKVKQEVSAVVNAALRGDLNKDTDQPYSLSDLEDHIYALFTDDKGQLTVPNSIIQQALAYAEHVWNNNVGAINKANPEQHGGGGPSGAPGTGGIPSTQGAVGPGRGIGTYPPPAGTLGG